jgi:hypothetical protein
MSHLKTIGCDTCVHIQRKEVNWMWKIKNAFNGI